MFDGISSEIFDCSFALTIFGNFNILLGFIMFSAFEWHLKCDLNPRNAACLVLLPTTSPFWGCREDIAFQPLNISLVTGCCCLFCISDNTLFQNKCHWCDDAGECLEIVPNVCCLGLNFFFKCAWFHLSHRFSKVRGFYWEVEIDSGPALLSNSDRL